MHKPQSNALQLRLTQLQCFRSRCPTQQSQSHLRSWLTSSWMQSSTASSNVHAHTCIHFLSALMRKWGCCGNILQEKMFVNQAGLQVYNQAIPSQMNPPKIHLSYFFQLCIKKCNRMDGREMGQLFLASWQSWQSPNCSCTLLLCASNSARSMIQCSGYTGW